jgi:enamine deaminase RidA (YjgF/YER057c/UK114 family)
MHDPDVLDRIASLGLSLPEPPSALAAYVPCVVEGGLAFVAGQIPMRDGAPLHPGLLGEGVGVEEAAEGARQAALQALAALRGGLGGSFGRLRRIVQVSVFVAATAGFAEHPTVANGASQLLVDVLGEAGAHARAAVGVASLPLGSSVEVALTASVDPD